MESFQIRSFRPNIALESISGRKSKLRNFRKFSIFGEGKIPNNIGFGQNATLDPNFDIAPKWYGARYTWILPSQHASKHPPYPQTHTICTVWLGWGGSNFRPIFRPKMGPKPANLSIYIVGYDRRSSEQSDWLFGYLLWKNQNRSKSHLQAFPGQKSEFRENSSNLACDTQNIFHPNSRKGAKSRNSAVFGSKRRIFVGDPKMLRASL